jgi:hypothetical protein
MKWAPILAASLSACSTFDLKNVKEREPLYDAQIKGSYAPITRCILDTLQRHEQVGVRRLQYDLRNYPDIQKSEIYGVINPGYGSVMHVLLVELQQDGNDNVRATARGMEGDRKMVSDTIQSCSKA